MAGMLRQTAAPAQQKNDLCPLFTRAGAPVVDFNTENTAIGAAGFLYVSDIPQTELLECTNRRFVSRIGEAQQSLAVEPLESECELRLADLGGDPPAPDISRQHEADLQIFRPQSLAGRETGKADDFACWTVLQNAMPVRRSPKVK
jgi:hypothetical protein